MATVPILSPTRTAHRSSTKDVLRLDPTLLVGRAVLGYLLASGVRHPRIDQQPIEASRLGPACLSRDSRIKATIITSDSAADTAGRRSKAIQKNTILDRIVHRAPDQSHRPQPATFTLQQSI
jgi:hypothetical protein